MLWLVVVAVYCVRLLVVVVDAVVVAVVNSLWMFQENESERGREKRTIRKGVEECVTR